MLVSTKGKLIFHIFGALAEFERTLIFVLSCNSALVVSVTRAELCLRIIKLINHLLKGTIGT